MPKTTPKENTKILPKKKPKATTKPPMGHKQTKKYYLKDLHL